MTTNAGSTALVSLQEQYPPSQYHLLLPTTSRLDVTAWHRLGVAVVNINANPRMGDVYQVASRRMVDETTGRFVKGDDAFEQLFALARPATDRVGMAAGVSYDPDRSKLVTATEHYVAYETVGGVRRPDGSWVAFKATKEIDLRAIEMELRENETKKVAAGLIGDEGQNAARLYPGKWEQIKTKWGQKDAFFVDPAHVGRCIDDRIRGQMIQWRKNKLMRAETGARLRVVRGLLGMPMQFTAEQLALPFAVPRIDFVPDYNDPEVKRALLAGAAAAMGGLYGRGGSTPGSASIDKEFIEDLPDDGEVMDADYRVMDPQPGAATARTEDLGARPAAQPPGGGQAQPSGAGQPQGAGTCPSCSGSISEAEASYSQRKYGRELCYKCQKAGKGAAL